MRRMQELARNPAMIALFAALMLTGCASKKNNLPNNAADLGLAGNAAPGTQQDFTVNVGDRIFFDTDSSVIRADAAATLDRQAQWLNQYPNYQITVEGHADERGTREYNLALGARRAAATGSICRPVAWRQTASTRSRSARSARSRSVMTSPAGRRTGVRSPFSAAPEADRRIRVLNAGWRSQGRHLFCVWGFSP
jgi:peptidoglycan-associated lipoprotein